MDFESVRNHPRNHQETLEFARVTQLAPNYPDVAQNEDMLVDVACLALNMLKPRYIRHSIDAMAHISNAERAHEATAVEVAVLEAFKLVQSGRRKDSR
jgi:hypothetical protein